MTTTVTATGRPDLAGVSLRELRDAWDALERGAFAAPRIDWSAARVDVAVVGAHSASGATTLAVAIADAHGHGHVLELASPARSGLVAAGRAEYGEITPGWRRTERDHVVLDYLAGAAAHIPAPAPVSGDALLIVDLAALATAGDGAHGTAAEVLDRAGAVVLTATATVPGMRGLQVALDRVPDPAVIAVTGPPRKRWHPAVTAACPAAALDLAGQGRLLILPPHPGLAVTGLTPDPLPAPLLAAAHDLLRLIPTAGNLVERTTR